MFVIVDGQHVLVPLVVLLPVMNRVQRPRKLKVALTGVGLHELKVTLSERNATFAMLLRKIVSMWIVESGQLASGVPNAPVMVVDWEVAAKPNRPAYVVWAGVVHKVAAGAPATERPVNARVVMSTMVRRRMTGSSSGVAARVRRHGGTPPWLAEPEPGGRTVGGHGVSGSEGDGVVTESVSR
jgi:hypothetical protein